MIEQSYQIGGISITMVGPEFHESEALSVFRTSTPAGRHLRYEVSLCRQLSLPEKLRTKPEHCHERLIPDENGTLRVIFHDATKEAVLTERQNGDVFKVELLASALPIWDSNLLLKLWRLPERLFEEGEFFLHASMIRVNDKAVIFTAQKQVGKSTQATLWEKYRGAEVINGDRALLRKVNDVWYACGSPYCGTSKICKVGSYPLAAIVILSQAKETTVTRAVMRQTAAAFLDGCSFDAGSTVQTEKVLDAALDAAAHVPVFCLACTPDESAVIALEKVLY